MKAWSFALPLLTGLPLLLAGCTWEADTTNVFLSEERLSWLAIEAVEGYLLVPGVDNPLRCMARYSGGAMQDWTGRVFWSTNDPAWASISPAGVLRPKRSGFGEVRAISPEGWVATEPMVVRRLVDLSLEFERDVLFVDEETTGQLTARRDDDLIVSVTRNVPVDWTVTNPSVASMAGWGEIQALRGGQTLITATVAGITSVPTLLTVDDVYSVACTTSADVPLLPLDTVRLQAVAVTRLSPRADVSDRVQWLLSDTSALMNLGGSLVVPTAPGNPTVRARLANVESPALELDVWHVTQIDLAVSDHADTLIRGDTVRFTARASVEGHGTQDLTRRVRWVATDSHVGQFIAPGVFEPRYRGTTEIYAQAGLVTSSRHLLNVGAVSLFDEGFETYRPGPFVTDARWFTRVYGYGTRLEIVDFGASGARSLMLMDSSDGFYSGVGTQPGLLDSVRSGTFEADVRGATGGMQLTIYLVGPDDMIALYIGFASGQIFVNDGYVDTYASSEWLHFRVEFDCATLRYDLYINDVQRRDQAGFYTTVSHVAGINLQTGSYAGVAYVDNILLDGDVAR